MVLKVSFYVSQVYQLYTLQVYVDIMLNNWFNKDEKDFVHITAKIAFFKLLHQRNISLYTLRFVNIHNPKIGLLCCVR